jgi:pimeloyl-ACP methyl ester carboxylesterase
MSDQLATPDTIVLLHGLPAAPSGWERWAGRYESRGYEVLSPAGAGPQTRAVAALVLGLPTPPMLMGLGAGAVVVCALLDRGYGAVGVAIDAPPGLAATAGGCAPLLELRCREPFAIGEDGWEQIVDLALSWAAEHARIR